MPQRTRRQVIAAARGTTVWRLGVVTLVVAFTLVAAGWVAEAAPPPPPCLNYTHAEEGGHIDVDLRFDPQTHAFSTLTIFLFINDPGAAPGTYFWNKVFNGVPMKPNFQIKDDNLHTISRMNDDHWVYGDRFKFQATHYSPATRKTYVAAYNECVITPR